jgi:CRISPR-associated endonuclease/helicase Cas3
MKKKSVKRVRSTADTSIAQSPRVPAGESAINVSLGQVVVTLVGRTELDDCPEVRADFPFDPSFIPQTRDLFNLFDTTPDLSGADIDISRFIRDGEDLDVLVFWRDDESGLGKGDFRMGCPFKKLLPAREELCPVATWRFCDFFKKLNNEQKKQVWVRDYRKGWVRLADPERIYSGQILLLHKQIGGYDKTTGWTGVAGVWKFEPCPSKKETEETASKGDNTQEDEDNAAGSWQSIHRHSVEVAEALNAILGDPAIHDSLDKDAVLAPLTYTPPWHDLGKAHEKFFAKLRSTARSEWPTLSKGDRPAKAPKDRWKSFFHDDEDRKEFERQFKRRPGFRHELASALALLETLRLASPNHPAVKIEDELRAAVADTPSAVADSHTTAAAVAALGPIADLDRLNFNLLLYLIACHHGKVRLGLRSSEDDYDLDQPDPVPEMLSGDGKMIRRCRGVQDNDVVPACRLPNPSKPADENSYVETLLLVLSLDPMETFSPRYGASWADRMRGLLETLGPFRLGYLEALIRAADARGSVPNPTSNTTP